MEVITKRRTHFTTSFYAGTLSVYINGKLYLATPSTSFRSNILRTNNNIGTST
jgi:hypothetical protein